MFGEKLAIGLCQDAEEIRPFQQLDESGNRHVRRCGIIGNSKRDSSVPQMPMDLDVKLRARRSQMLGRIDAKADLVGDAVAVQPGAGDARLRFRGNQAARARGGFEGGETIRRHGPDIEVDQDRVARNGVGALRLTSRDFAMMLFGTIAIL